MTKKLLFISLILLGLTQFSFAQATAKKKLAGQISTNTVDLFPVQYFEDEFGKMTAKESEKLEEELNATFVGKIEKTTLTAEDKGVLKQRSADFIHKIAQTLQSVMMKNFNLKTAANKSLEKHYQKTFTLAELQKLNNFFKTADGQLFVKKFNQMVTGKLDGKDANFTDVEEKEFERLAGKLGNKILGKFTDSIVENVMDDINKYVENWAKQVPANIEKEMTNGNLKKEMEKFVAENFKQ